MSKNIIVTKSFAFAVRTVKLYEYLKKEKQEFMLAKQVLRSGTSIGANVEEAIAGQSAADFIHKLSIARKESRETSYWLRLLYETGYIAESQFISIHADCEEIIKILNSIIITSKAKLDGKLNS